MGLGGVVHSCIPAYWFDYWLTQKARLREGDPFFRLLWDLLEIMDSMFLEHHHRRRDVETDD